MPATCIYFELLIALLWFWFYDAELKPVLCTQQIQGQSGKSVAFLILLFPDSVMETCGVVLTFESVDEILWCDHSNETSSAVLLHGNVCVLIFYKMKSGIFLNFDFW